ncbi:MAG: 5'-methylthioadenosine/adenosylhomocysteine nucleosidase [Paenibacillaceae bacterium]
MTYSKIGIMGAMAEEVKLIEHDMKQPTITIIAGMSFYEGLLFEVPVVLCKSGVGKVNAAICTQILITKFGVDCVLFTGVAGALDPELNIGDIVISTDCMQHDVDVRALGFALGVIPYADTSIFVADPELVDIAFESSKLLFGNQIWKGRILSGDQFIADRDKVKQLHLELLGSCTEMEGAAVAQACQTNGIPFVIIRSMSDRADGSAQVNFAEFTQLASDNSYRLIAHMVRELRGQVQ